MSSLTPEAIDALLNDNTTQTSTSKAPHARPIQLGPLRYVDVEHRCARRGCAVACYIKVLGVPYCNTHALYALNVLLMKNEGLGWAIEECNCESGKYSQGCMHNDMCATFVKLKEIMEGRS